MKSNTIQIILIVLAVILVIGAFAVITKDKDTPDDGILGGTGDGRTDTETDNPGSTETEKPGSTETEAPSDSEKETEAACLHSYVTDSVVRQATCGQIGLKILSCTKCGEKRNETIPKLAEHSFGEGVEGVEGCNVVISYTCTVCNATKQEETNELSHSFVDGVCSRCGEIIAQDGTADGGDDGSCKHENITTYARNETGCHPYNETYCDDCGYYFGYVDLEVSHQFYEGENTCCCGEVTR